MRVHEYPESGFPAGCSEAGCMVHGFLLLFRVKEWEGPQIGHLARKRMGDVWLIMRVLCLIDLLCFFCDS